MSQFKLVQTLADDINKLLQGPGNCDLQIIVGSGESKQTFQAYSAILKARSPYFSRALSPTWAKKEGDKLTFEKPNIAPKVFETILE